VLFEWKTKVLISDAQILKGAESIEGRPGASMPSVDFDQLRKDLVEKHGEQLTDKDLLSAALYPKVFDDFQEFRKQFGPVDKLDTKTFLVGPDIAHEINVRSSLFVILD